MPEDPPKPEPHKRKIVTGRNELARDAHLRSGAGAMGGTRVQQARRRRRQDKLEEQQAEHRDQKDEG